MNAGSELLSVEHVSVSLSGRAVLRDVNFKLAPGELCALIGANGSGKTTLLKTILGLVRPQSGAVRMAGASGRVSGMGYVPQKISFDPNLPLRARDVVSLGFDGGRLGLPLPSRERRARVDQMLNAVGATGFAERRLGELSGGQQQRVLIAHALVRRPRLLLLDEPLASLDVRSVAEIVLLLRRLATEYETSVLLSAHDMNALLPVMDRIVYLANGSAVAGKPEEVVRTEVLSRLYGYHIDVVRVHGRVVVIAAEAPDEIHAAIARDPIHTAEVP
ncbi:MAG: ATP-binding cassette domain-containing protein [Proteobacteria bacterium]|nr:ATP-binding cassette domain-containing protein [Pseudomonadota bacterium]